MKLWTPRANAPKPLHVIKPTYSGEMPSLTPARLLENSLANRETVLHFDTNVLRRMDDFARAGGRPEILAEHGLDQLVQLLNQPSHHTMVLVPGMALDELPPGMRARFHSIFEWFISRFTPQYRDHPSAIPPGLWTPQYHNTYWDLTRETQFVFAVPYALLLLLQAALSDNTAEQEPQTCFSRFVQLAVAEIDVLSAREVEVARWCLSPQIPRDNTYQKRRKAMRENFAEFQKRAPRSIGEQKHVALNGARDLHMVMTAVYADAKGLDGISQDTWIVTYDGKLATYCKLFNYLPMGPLSGAIATLTNSPSDNDPGYWDFTAQLLSTLNRERIGKALNRAYNAEDMIARVRRAEALLESVSKHRFRQAT